MMKARLGISSRAFIVNYGGYRGCGDRSVSGASTGASAGVAAVVISVGVTSGVAFIVGVGGFGGQRDRGSAVGLGAGGR